MLAGGDCGGGREGVEMCGRLLICAKAQSEATHKPQQVCDLFLGTIKGQGREGKGRG